MPFEWFKAHKVVKVGLTLADHYVPPPSAEAGARAKSQGSRPDQGRSLQQLLQRAEREAIALQLTVFQRAKFANTIKWRLIENGVEQQLADEVTRRLVVHIAALPADRSPSDPRPDGEGPAKTADFAGTGTVRTLGAQGDLFMARGAYAEALRCYESMVDLNPRNVEALNSLGAVLCMLSRYQEAEACFRRAVRVNPNGADSHANLGSLLRWRGQGRASEQSLRRALKLKAGDVEIRISLGLTLLSLSRTSEASEQFEKALKVAPRHANALFGMGEVARLEGRFEQAATLFQRILEVDPKQVAPLAGLASLRKMTTGDHAWLRRAEALAASGLSSREESTLRYAIGKYYDDVRDFESAFRNFRRANELYKTVAEAYDRAAQTRFVDEQMRIHTRESLSRPQPGASMSEQPVFVVGMMRSGTSLAEQIIASHPGVHGAGELSFWSDAAQLHGPAMRQGLLDEQARRKLALSFLQLLSQRSDGARRVVDKAPINSEYLGLIHSVFPNARIIYMRRDPIDTCLSCYFQHFSASLNFTTDLEDIAHYYREHQRLMGHWRAVLPAGAMLEVPYAELVADQEGWTRRMLEYLGLEWDPRCLDFHNTQRTVATASAWQVRQKIYRDSVQRWRHYAKYIGPLQDLRDP